MRPKEFVSFEFALQAFRSDLLFNCLLFLNHTLALKASIFIFVFKLLRQSLQCAQFKFYVAEFTAWFIWCIFFHANQLFIK